MTVTLATAAQRAVCLAIRAEVFLVEQGVPEADEIDGLDDDALHLLAWHGGIAVGTLRLRRTGEVAKVERVCVRAPHRRQGHAAAMTRRALDIARGWPIRAVRLSAQTAVIGFYERFGFAATGGVYMDAGIPHRDMVLPA